MGRERKLRLFTVLGLFALAVLSAVLLRAGAGAWVVRMLRATCAMPQTPLAAFGTFHFAALGICVCLAVLTGILAWHHRRTGLTDRLVFAAGVLFFLLEWYKQLFCFYVLGSGTYDFSVFPFQFCSLPTYFCLLAPMLGERAKHTLYCFLALFGTVGGYLVMVYPNLPGTLTLCIHTMLWHTLMILLGVWLLIAEGCGGSFAGDYLPAAGVFLAAFAAATVLNLALHRVAAGQGTVLNLYYMSPYYRINYVLIGDVRRALGWGAAMAAYVLLFLSVGALPLWILGAVFCRIRKKDGKNEKMRKKF